MKNKWWTVSKKAILCVLLIALIGSGWASAREVEAEFSDVSVNWSYKHISKLALLGVINGMGDGTFAPNESVTREQVLIMATQLMGADEYDVESSRRDVLPDKMKVSEWAKGYVALALRNGLINVQEEREVIQRDNPEDREDYHWGSTPATREWVAKVTIRAAGKDAQARLLSEQSVPFADRSRITAGYEGYINAAVQLEIVSGMPGNVFNPTDPVTRAQMAVFLSLAEAYMDKLDDRVTIGTIVNINDDDITIRDERGDEHEYDLHRAVRYFSAEVNDNTVSPDLFELNQTVYAIHDGNAVYYLEWLDGESADELESGVGILLSIDTDARGIELWMNGNYETFTLSDHVRIVDKEDNSVRLSDLSTNSEIELSWNTTTNEVVAIIVTDVPINKYSDGVLQTSEPEDSLIVLDNISEKEEEYAIAEDVRVEYDGRSILLSDLREGDKIEYRVQDSIITRIELLEPVEPLMEMLEGQLVSAVDSTSPVITLRTSGGPVAYDISSNVEVELSGKPTARLSDLEAGDQVRISINELDGNKVERIEVLNRSIRMVAGAKVVYFNRDHRMFFVEIPGESGLQGLQINENTSIDQISDWDDELIESIYTEGRRIDLTFTNQQLVAISLSDYYDGTITSIDQTNRTIYLDNRDFGEMEFKWTASTHMASDRNNARITDFLVGDEVRITLSASGDTAASIRLIHDAAYRLVGVFENRRELLVLDEDGTEQIRVSRDIPVRYGNVRNAWLNDLPLDHTIFISFVGDTAVSVEVPDIEYGRVVSVQNGQLLRVATPDGELLSLEADKLSGVIRNGTVRVGGLSELRTDDRVEIAIGDNGKFWAQVMDREEKEFWKYDDKKRRISFYTDRLTRKNEFDLHEHVYIHSDGEELDIEDLKNKDDLDVWFLYDIVMEIERK